VVKTRKVQVWLPAEALCEVEVQEPNEDGQADIVSISLVQRGNFEAPVNLPESSALTDEVYEEIDRLAAEAFNG
jgi:hypothetical protein